MRTHRRVALFSVVFFFFALPQALFAASISFSPASGNKSVGEEFSVQVRINPDGKSVNASDGEISFDPSVLSVTSVSRDGSSFSLWTSDPTFSNSAGTVSYSGGTPSAFSGAGTAITIRFRGKAAGTGGVSVKSATILAADGKGTDVYSGGEAASFTIAEKAAPPATTPTTTAPPVSAGSTDILVPAPVITSSTHKKPEQWHATTTAILSWKIPPAMIRVRTSISEDPETKPTEVFDPIINTQTFTDLTEGIWYFAAQFKDDFEWGEIGTYEIRVDVTPPEEFDVAILDRGDGSPPKFIFGTDDALSGMSRYEIFLNEAIVATVQQGDLVDNGFLIPPQDGGVQTVTIKAYDQASNVREVTKQLEVPYVEKPKEPGAEDQNTSSGFRFEWVIIALFAFAVGGLVAWQIQMKKVAKRDHARILERVLSTREMNDRVFAAMREEFEQIVNDFDERPQLTPQERDLLEKIKEVLDISEEVVDSDIEELKRLIKEL